MNSSLKVLFFLAIVAAFAPGADAGERGALQDKPGFSTCGWWQTLNADEMDQFYRVGFTQGLVVGTVADPLPDTPSDEAKPVFALYQAGQEVFLQKPSLVEDYFKAKCAEPRNATVGLHGLVMLAMLEEGGLDEDRIEVALQLYRKELAPRRIDVLEALTRQ